MAGHLFGYEAALAIDAQARPLREAAPPPRRPSSATRRRGLLDRLARSWPAGRPPASSRTCGPAPTTATSRPAPRCGSPSLLRYATGVVPLEAYEVEYGKVGTPSVVLEDLTDALTRGIEELTRPIDAIKHQAKTVTVGISRSEDALLAAPLVRELLAAGAGRDRLSYRALRTLAALDPAVAEVTGYTRYRIDGSASEGQATIAVLDKGGVAAGVPSRAEQDPRLRGTKHRVAREREVTVAWRQRRAHVHPRARDQGQPDHRAHPAARAVPGPLDARRSGDGAAGLPGSLRHPCGTRSPRPSPSFADAVLADAAWSTSSPSPCTCWPTAGGCLRRHDGDRHRRCRGRPLPPRPGPNARRRPAPLHRRRAGGRRPPSDPTQRLAARFAAKEAVMKALGVGLGAFTFHDVEVVRAESGARRSCSTGAADLAAERGVSGWHLSLTPPHTWPMAIVVAVAVGTL